MVNGKALALVKKSKQVEKAKGKKGKKAKGHKGKRAKSRRYVLAAGGQLPTEGHCLRHLSALCTTWNGLINSNFNEQTLLS